MFAAFWQAGNCLISARIEARPSRRKFYDVLHVTIIHGSWRLRELSPCARSVPYRGPTRSRHRAAAKEWKRSLRLRPKTRAILSMFRAHIFNGKVVPPPKLIECAAARGRVPRSWTREAGAQHLAVSGVPRVASQRWGR